MDVATACQSLISEKFAAIAPIEFVLLFGDLGQCLLDAAYFYAHNPAYVLSKVAVARLVGKTLVVLDAGIITDMSLFT